MTPRRRDPSAKRAAVINVARDAFGQAAFADVSTSAIATDADVSEGIVFHHFGSKLGLVEACAAADGVAFITTETPRHGDGLDYDRLARSIFDWVGGDPMTRRIWSDGEAHVVAALGRGWRSAIVPAVSALLETEQLAGRCRIDDPSLLARLMFAVVSEMLVAGLDGSTPQTHAVGETARLWRSIADPADS